MNCPNGLSEAKVLAVFDRVVAVLATRFTFGYFDVNDIKQEGRKFCLEALPRYTSLRARQDMSDDPERALENFLHVHVKNRLINLKRDKFSRTDPPCLLCHRAVGLPTEHPDGQFCRSYLEWKKRNAAKANLSRPLDITNHEEHTRRDSDVEDTAQMREILHRIDAALPVELRETYLRMRANQPVPKSRRQAVEAIVRPLIQEAIHGRSDAAAEGS